MFEIRLYLSNRKTCANVVYLIVKGKIDLRNETLIVNVVLGGRPTILDVGNPFISQQS